MRNHFLSYQDFIGESEISNIRGKSSYESTKELAQINGWDFSGEILVKKGDKKFYLVYRHIDFPISIVLCKDEKILEDFFTPLKFEMGSTERQIDFIIKPIENKEELEKTVTDFFSNKNSQRYRYNDGLDKLRKNLESLPTEVLPNIRGAKIASDFGIIDDFFVVGTDVSEDYKFFFIEGKISTGKKITDISYQDLQQTEGYKRLIKMGFEDVTGESSKKNLNFGFKLDPSLTSDSFNYWQNAYYLTNSGYVRRENAQSPMAFLDKSRLKNHEYTDSQGASHTRVVKTGNAKTAFRTIEAWEEAFKSFEEIVVKSLNKNAKKKGIKINWK